MQPTRYVGIPVDHVAAEMAAFPLASERALELALISLMPGLDGATGQLWEHAEGDTLGRFPGFSVDEAVAIRDRLWFGTSRETVPLHEYLRKLADEVLELRGSEAVPKLVDNLVLGEQPTVTKLPERRRWWRWLAFALPPDLLLAAVGNQQGGPDTVNLLSPGLDRQLADQGFAETHLHLGAALDFPQLWVGALHAIANQEVNSDQFRSPGAGLNGGLQLGPWLIRAALARYVLAAYLAWGRKRGDFATFLQFDLPARLAKTGITGAYQTLVAELIELRTGHLAATTISFQICQTLYSVLAGLKHNGWWRPIERIQELDPIHDLLPRSGSGRPTPEVHFVRLALAYLRERHLCEENLKKEFREKKIGEKEFRERHLREKRDAWFEQLFWQVIRVRTLFYRHAVQRPMTPGLQWFIRFYGRLRPARNPFSTRMQFQAAARVCGRDHGLRSLEVRTSPWADRDSLAEFVANLEQAHLDMIVESSTPSFEPSLPRPQPFEFGIVFHFTKDRGGGALSGKPKAFWQQSHADPRFIADQKGGNPTGYRYAHFYNEKKKEALALARLLETYPLSLQVVRGLDVCTDELGVPSWVFVPLLEHVREAANGAATFARSRLGCFLPPLRTTIHAGEDFVHLLTGLRMVDEAVEQLKLREGDRIGHGVSLGVNPHDWSRRAGRLAMSQEDRLWDLVWEWSWYSRSGDVPIKGRQQMIEYQLSKLSMVMFGERVEPAELETLSKDLTKSDRLKAVGFPNGLVERTNVGDDRRRCLLYRWLTCHELFNAGRDIVWVEPVQERLVLAHLQAQLRKKMGALGIVVEINPTSNLLIGDLEDLTRHPMWRLCPPRPLKHNVPPVGVCVGSDDPLTFNSNLRQEYQCLADSMLLAGLSDEEARDWLDRTRTCGLESRFTIPRVSTMPIRGLIQVPHSTGNSLP
ncbi:MAG: hypothetical protein IAG10_31040 [Planctomycetaceae bacterium]|nr:hypothetical protein [Planctomycetaceae bacterium]